ncbi:hypothetical protein [Cytobacillus gottheilii]|uniref:hypothetical protein n=1 Tax=Cytobacillus gottheilii TaxID=859144 RepID=UPI002493F3F5|nr:hypothetical protein [Cytobacillus gottheilii]
MNWIIQHYNVLYILVIGLLLFFCWHFFQKSQFDERRKKRFSLRTNQYQAFYKNKFHNEKFEKILRKSGMPTWITSERINLIRYGILLTLIFLVFLGLLTQEAILSFNTIMLWGFIAFCLTPIKPLPLYFVIQFVRSNYLNNVSDEIYQLYNEIKSNFQTKGGGYLNSYYTIKNALPYYKSIRTTLEKMIPYLEKRKLEEAWTLFSTELETKESQMLALVMEEIESLDHDQALLLLEQKRQEFSNHLYNRYTEKLRRRKTIIYSLVVVCIMTVFVNEITVFYAWYKEIMDVSKQFF